ncbi:MAG: hypothetical protein IT384_03785 [Deltaproteobacteria bacterium]|nr:hypothetical protein [Deltaproteobacteria bacterium]
MARWGAVGLAVVALACNEAPPDGLRTTFPDATGPDGSVVGPDATVPELDLADALAKYCRELDEVWVRRAVRCLGGTERAWSELDGLYECRDLVSALQAGHLAFDPVAGALCLAGYEQLSCDQLFGTAPWPLPVCGHVMWGLLPEGAPCEGPFQCGEALACDEWLGIWVQLFHDDSPGMSRRFRPLEVSRRVALPLSGRAPFA